MHQLLLFLLCIIKFGTSCDPLTGGANVADFQPDSKAAVDEEATLTCDDKYLVTWATALGQNSDSIKCTAGDAWVPKGQESFSGTIGCVGCLSGIAMCDAQGTCTDGKCVCNTNYKNSPDDPLLCLAVQCEIADANADVDSDGPYAVGAVIKVSCKASYYVDGKEGETEQTVTCTSDGSFDKDLKPCLAKTGSQCSAFTSLTKQQADTSGPYNVNDKIKIMCESGHHVKGTTEDTVQTVTCLDTGKFDKDPEPCVADVAQCLLSDLSHQSAEPDQETYAADAVVTVTCDAGFHVDGTSNDTEQVVVCNDDGNFNTTVKPCVDGKEDDVQCLLSDLSHQSADPDGGPYDVNAAVTVTCDAGFHVEGTTDVTKQFVLCNDDGNFNTTVKPCVDGKEDKETDDKKKDDKKKTPVGAIVGGTVGGILVVLAAAACVAVFVKKTKTRVGAAAVKVTVNVNNEGTVHTSTANDV